MDFPKEETAALISVSLCLIQETQDRSPISILTLTIIIIQRFPAYDELGLCRTSLILPKQSILSIKHMAKTAKPYTQSQKTISFAHMASIPQVSDLQVASPTGKQLPTCKDAWQLHCVPWAKIKTNAGIPNLTFPKLKPAHPNPRQSSAP